MVDEDTAFTKLCCVRGYHNSIYNYIIAHELQFAGEIAASTKATNNASDG